MSASERSTNINTHLDAHAEVRRIWKEVSADPVMSNTPTAAFLRALARQASLLSSGGTVPSAKWDTLVDLIRDALRAMAAEE